ncbi:MAG: DUF1145 domain-containing protein [Shewanella sp.]|nr:DUF1145 domain-containing protein [Shewanella sp.]MCF1430237.1 DUF1145 domain-containing protein [Shewanella sp.]MCF1438444.1 DUF1145 domain-containing protein [Shewanella sp.]MCF1457483.1 DUF1145 domain-containing protein [Shewanella sp.]
MKYVLLTGKTMTLFAWGVMIFNLFMPFPGNTGLALNILLLVTAFMHAMQVLMFYSMFSQQMKLTKKDFLTVFGFGVFALLEYRKKLMLQLQHT